jgi:hypothetical protein
MRLLRVLGRLGFPPPRRIAAVLRVPLPVRDRVLAPARARVPDFDRDVEDERVRELLRRPRAPPSSLFTVAHAIRAALFAERPRRFALPSILRALRFCLLLYEPLSPRGMNSSSLVWSGAPRQHVPYRARQSATRRVARPLASSCRELPSFSTRSAALAVRERGAAPRIVAQRRGASVLIRRDPVDRRLRPSADMADERQPLRRDPAHAPRRPENRPNPGDPGPEMPIDPAEPPPLEDPVRDPRIPRGDEPPAV